jgi:hypothetical protein
LNIFRIDGMYNGRWGEGVCEVAGKGIYSYMQSMA